MFFCRWLNKSGESNRHMPACSVFLVTHKKSLLAHELIIGASPKVLGNIFLSNNQNSKLFTILPPINVYICFRLFEVLVWFWIQNLLYKWLTLWSVWRICAAVTVTQLKSVAFLILLTNVFKSSSFAVLYLFTFPVRSFRTTKKMKERIVDCDFIYTVYGCFLKYIYCNGAGLHSDKQDTCDALWVVRGRGYWVLFLVLDPSVPSALVKPRVSVINRWDGA